MEVSRFNKDIKNLKAEIHALKVQNNYQINPNVKDFLTELAELKSKKNAA